MADRMGLSCWRWGLAAVLLVASTLARAEDRVLSDDEVAGLSMAAVMSDGTSLPTVLDALVARGKPDVAATLILAMRYQGPQSDAVAEAFRALTGSDAENWFEAMLWQEAHPEITPHPSYREVKLAIFQLIDENFMRFLGGDRGKQENLKIRLEEITWGGVRVDGIPSLDNPKRIPAAEADYLQADDLVFGVAINGDVRAYPLRIMGWHEMFNEVIGGVPVALAYCTLCGSGILFETQVEGRDKPLVFGSSGFLYRSNKLMFDRETDSLWNQFTGRPVSGPLRDSGIELKIRPVAITTWAAWREQHPDTTVLSLDTGFRRDYGSGVVYRHYFASPDLMFPALVREKTGLKQKDYVFGIRAPGVAKAWPLSAFEGGAVINDRLGDRPLVLIGDMATRTVRAYDRGGREFAVSDTPGRLNGPGGSWQVGEEGLTGPAGERLARMPGHIAYWFAWDGYLGVRSELYGADD